MSMTKMALVPQELLTRFQQHPDPSPATKATIALDTEMKNILERTDIDEDEKVKLYNQTLSRYLTLDKQRKQPLEMKLTSTERLEGQNLNNHNEKDSVSSSSDEHKHGLEDDVLVSVPSTLRKKAERLLKHLKTDKNVIDWNDKGEIVANGSVVKGSHLIDLVNDTLRKRKHFSPRGWKEFNKALFKLNTPQDLVGNTDRWKYQQFGDDVGESTNQYYEADGATNHSGLFAEAYHLSPKQKKKRKKYNKKTKHRQSFDTDDDMVVTSTTSPHRWNDY